MYASQQGRDPLKPGNWKNNFNGDEMGLNGKPGRPMEVFHGFSMVSIWFYRL